MKSKFGNPFLGLSCVCIEKTVMKAMWLLQTRFCITSKNDKYITMNHAHVKWLIAVNSFYLISQINHVLGKHEHILELYIVMTSLVIWI